MKRIVWMAVLSLLAVLCSGCGSQTREKTDGGQPVSVTSMESTPVIDYTVPQLTPNVLVDRLGYQAVGDKAATVKGRALPTDFCLVDADTGEVVYQGTIEKVVYNLDTQLFVGQAEFGEYETPGNYYLECSKVGRSYTFPIAEKLYIQLFEEQRDRVLESCENGEATVPEVTELLIAYEWYPALFGDEDENEIPDVLEVIAKWMQNQEGVTTGTEDEALQAALVAKFSYLYQKYDKAFATKCLQGASAMYEQTQKTMHKDAESFFALTELYRATGLWTYRSQIADYETYFENSSHLEETEYLYGAMTYMVTRQKVDVTLCDTLIEKLMERGEELAGNYSETIHPVNAKNNGADDILKRAKDIVFVNYILNSYQYYNVLVDFQHYLGGRNQQSVIFDEEESLLMLAQMASMPERK